MTDFADFAEALLQAGQVIVGDFAHLPGQAQARHVAARGQLLRLPPASPPARQLLRARHPAVGHRRVVPGVGPGREEECLSRKQTYDLTLIVT